ncbi:anti-sigma factor domain-containing protein [Specibacter sp. NPDC057265]|uniref:anti-sigma factor n=1 Tax=Specibacter sp. NPDC057265 TaxID=3346075 RepID=UPI0036415A7A
MMEKQLHLLTGSYALNSLTDDERSDFERSALFDPQTLEEVRSLSETASLLAYATPAEAPPEALKANVMAAIRNTRQLPASSVVRDISSARKQGARERGAGTAAGAAGGSAQNRRWVPALSAAAALLLFGGVGAGSWVAGQNSVSNDPQQQVALEQMQEQLNQTEENQKTMLAIMSAADTKIATTPLAGGVTVTVASSEAANRAAVMVNEMPELPADKSYELWLISAAGAVPAGLMGGTEQPALQILEGQLGAATHVGITVEPAGGSDEPTTTPLLVQEI